MQIRVNAPARTTAKGHWLKTPIKRAVMWAYGWHLISPKAAWRIFKKLRLQLA